MKAFILWTWVAISPANPTIVTIDGYETLTRCRETGQQLDSVWASMGTEHHFVCLEAK